MLRAWRVRRPGTSEAEGPKQERQCYCSTSNLEGGCKGRDPSRAAERRREEENKAAAAAAACGGTGDAEGKTKEGRKMKRPVLDYR
jgi:hypothetical protein